jgi:YgiT-type zinc finger domain-containing protein
VDGLEAKEGTKAMKKCPLCGGSLQAKRITRPQEYKGKVIILEHVPAEVCQQCGEAFLSPAILEQVQELVWSQAAPKRTTQVPVYDLAESD